MTDYPYVANTGNLREFVKGIISRGSPDEITLKYLEQCGFKSKGDRGIVKVLRFIGFLDEAGVPTEHYEGFLDTTKQGAIMAQCLRQAYSSLFDIHPNPCRMDVEALANFFRPVVKLGQASIERMVMTFKVLCEFADFGAEVPEVVSTTEPEIISVTRPTAPTGKFPIHFNIHLVLPETKDTAIYDAIFKSLKKHLLSESVDD